MPHASLSQAEDVNIVNGVHELGHKWCAYPLTRARTGIDYAPPFSLCIYDPEPSPELGHTWRAPQPAPEVGAVAPTLALPPATTGTRLHSGCPAAPITPSATGTTGSRP